MPQPRANNGTDRYPDEEFVCPILGAAFVLIELKLNQIAQIDTYCPANSVPPHTTIAYRNGNRVYIPCYII